MELSDPPVRRAIASSATGEPILFYDGDCGLCARIVRLVLRRDRRGVFRFAPLQGTTYAALRVAKPEDLSTVVLLDEAGLHRRADAVVRVGRRLGGGWRLLALLAGALPRGVRDSAYAFVAARRLRWFGRGDACALASEAERERFLA